MARTNHTERNQHCRIIAHFDLDAFYVGCERELNPQELLGVPVAVSQYNPYGSLQERRSDEFWKRLVVHPGHSSRGQNSDANGGLIAVSYEARAAGVRRNDRGLEASQKCRDLRIVQVPVKRGKADLTMYRDASQRVLDALVYAVKDCISGGAGSKIKVEKASIDEIYIDLTAPALEMAQSVLLERERLSAKEGSAVDGDDRVHGTENGTLCMEKKRSSWSDILASSGVAMCTTIGGVETMSDAALAAARLSKDELRRGSKLQVLDSSASSTESKPLDEGSRLWWSRDMSQQWTDTEIGLACGAAIAARARNAVSSRFRVEKESDGSREGDVFTLSAGISSNKTLAKLASGLKKPNRQTLINPLDGDALRKLFFPLPVGRIRGLGGKFGDDVSRKLGVSTVGDLARLPLSDIELAFPPSPEDGRSVAQYLFSISRGVCTDEVTERTIPKSIACGKTFRGQLAMDPADAETVRNWAGKLCGELTERLSTDRVENSRTPSLLIISVKMSDRSSSVSRSVKAPRSFESYTDVAVKQIQKLWKTSPCNKIICMSVTATSFVEVADGSKSIMAAFGRGQTQTKSDGHGTARQNMKSSVPVHNKHRTCLNSFWTKAENQVTSSDRTHRSHINGNPDRIHMLDNSKEVEKLNAGSQECSNSVRNAPLSSKLKVFVESAPDETAEKNEQMPAAVDLKDIDSKVLTQLPASLRSETRSSSTPSKRSHRNAANQGMDRWLVRGAASTGTMKSLAQDKIEGHRPKPFEHFFDTVRRKDQTLPRTTQSFSSLTWDEIDPEVLNELPSDVRKTILGEMHSERMVKRQKGQIDKYLSK